MTDRKETITRTANAEFAHKKQIGGGGEFALVRLRLEPLPRGAGIVFENGIAGDAIPRAFVPAIEEAIRSCADAGGVYGYPVVDFRAILVVGAYHEFDSNARTFGIAAEGAFHQALRKAGPIILLR
jgi:elongation factor G